MVNTVHFDQTPHFAASDLGLHCFVRLIPPPRDAEFHSIQIDDKCVSLEIVGSDMNFVYKSSSKRNVEGNIMIKKPIVRHLVNSPRIDKAKDNQCRHYKMISVNELLRAKATT